MDLIDFTVGRPADPATWATWTVLATATGEATEYRVCTADDTGYHVVQTPNGPHEVIVAVSEHGDYVSALRAVAAYIEEDN